MTPSGIPAFVLDCITNSFTSSDAQDIFDGYHQAHARPTTFRINTLKTSKGEVLHYLTNAHLEFDTVSWYSDALIMHKQITERTLWNTEIYQNGSIYLQSLSSMIPPLALEPREGTDILDMCAAPGGKTTQIAAITQQKAHITACEIHAPRAEKLTYNLHKQGAQNVQVMRCDARKLDTFFSFDQILLDAPCTGTGTIRAHNSKAERITPSLLNKVVRSQQALLDRALTILKPHGILVYSTCSILPAENENQILTALKRHRNCKVVPLSEALVSALPLLPSRIEGAICVAPTRTYEGFFICKITKN